MRSFMITVRHMDGEWDRLTPSEQEEHGTFLKDFSEQLQREKNSQLVFLHPPASAKTVRRLRDRSIEMGDGTVEESDEPVGLYYIIEAETLEEAVEWAEKGRFMVGVNEVREIFRGPPLG